MSFLNGSTYGTGIQADDRDYLDERGSDPDTYNADGQRLHADPNYADHIYGRVAYSADGTAWLQYWFFYYYNPQELAGQGVHEGDWEMIQLRMKPDLSAPDEATYARHRDGEHARCAWSAVEKTPGDQNSPIVYVANGSHASYFARGDYPRGTPPGALPTDEADGLGRPPGVRPPIEVIRETSPAWVTWGGRWGADTTSFNFGDSPLGFPRNSKWTDPQGLRESATTQCTVGGSGTAVYPSAAERRARRSKEVSTAPPAPEFRAKRRGREVIIRYHFGPLAQSNSTRPARVVAAVSPSIRSLAPSVAHVPVSRRVGRLKVKLPQGRGPYVARVSAPNRYGTRGPVVTDRVR